MLNRLFTALTIVSLAVLVAVAVLWWRGDHGHRDHFHLGASSATQTVIYTGPTNVGVEVQQHTPEGIRSEMRFYPFRSVLGGCLFLPGLWLAVRLRRRLLPRRPGWELPR